MNYWVVSPNVTNSREEEAAWKQAILDHEVAIMGWGQGDRLGDMFIDDVQVGDIILIAQGANWKKKLFLAGKVAGPAIQQHLTDTSRSAWQRKLIDCVKADELNAIDFDFEGSAFGDTNQIPAIYRLKPWNNEKDKAIAEKLSKAVNKKLEMSKTDDVINLLRYKKQIILQGPPGTGKTRMAKEIADQLVGTRVPQRGSLNTINKAHIVGLLEVGQIIKTRSGKNLQIVAFEEKVMTVKTDDSQPWNPSYEKIIHSYNNRLFDQTGRAGGFIPYEDAIAKHIYDNCSIVSNHKSEEDNIKLLQFHPSYSYEDFVRGIVAESNGEKIEYKNVNKLLGRFADEAAQNWRDSKKEVSDISREKRAKEYFERFVDSLSEKITGGVVIQLTSSVSIVDVEEDAFRYKGNAGWNVLGNRMLFKDIIQAFLDGNKVRQDIKKNKNLSGLAIQHASYFVRVLNMFQEYLETNNLRFEYLSADKVELKNYVLIIDEINRANLSSVLGELIYALEYRGENVESMYAVDGSNELVLPPNLYIIGTMNTADRSVGHIDYAIRRRFAFVDVLPEVLHDNFETALFQKVSSFFVKDITAKNLEPSDHLSSEFKPKDVWLGHSYFIKKEGVNSRIRLQYEIIPILEEYIKDGVLKESKELREAIDKLENEIV